MIIKNKYKKISYLKMNNYYFIYYLYSIYFKPK